MKTSPESRHSKHEVSNSKRYATSAALVIGLGAAAFGIDHMLDKKNASSETPSTEPKIVRTTEAEPQSIETIDPKQFIKFEDTGATTSKVETLRSEDGVFITTATIAAEDYELVSDLGTITDPETNTEYGVTVSIDFVANKTLNMVNFPDDYEDYQLGPSLTMSRLDASAQRDTVNYPDGGGHYAHFEMPIYNKQAMFPDGKDMVITFEGTTAADGVGARIVSRLDETALAE